MFKIDDKQNIFLTRGDTAVMQITLKEPKSPYNEYILQTGDEIYFSVRKAFKDIENSEIILQKIFTDNKIILESTDTEYLDYGEYFYDVEINFANGDINTVIPFTAGCSTKFVLTGEVR